MFLVNFFKKLNINRDPILQEEIQKFSLLKNKIAAIITTNYDCFLENFCNYKFSRLIKIKIIFFRNYYGFGIHNAIP